MFISCNEPARDHDATSSDIARNTISNNIQLEVRNLDVSRAVLVNEQGNPVSSNNTTDVNKPLKLRVFINNGWVAKKGKVALGAYQKIETFQKQVVLEEKDLFEEIGPISSEEAKIITISANIKKIYRKKDSFHVSFRIWDKNGTGNIEGSYKLIVNSPQ